MNDIDIVYSRVGVLEKGKRIQVDPTTLKNAWGTSMSVTTFRAALSKIKKKHSMGFKTKIDPKTDMLMIMRVS